jgi:hypothetical protein
MLDYYIIYSIYINGSFFCPYGCDVIMSSSVAYIVGPQDDINSLNEILGFDENDGSIDCGLIQDLPGIYI